MSPEDDQCWNSEPEREAACENVLTNPGTRGKSAERGVKKPNIKPVGLEKGVPGRACRVRSPFHAVATRFTSSHLCRGAERDPAREVYSSRRGSAVN